MAGGCLSGKVHGDCQIIFDSVVVARVSLQLLTLRMGVEYHGYSAAVFYFVSNYSSHGIIGVEQHIVLSFLLF